MSDTQIAAPFYTARVRRAKASTARLRRRQRPVTIELSMSESFAVILLLLFSELVVSRFDALAKMMIDAGVERRADYGAEAIQWQWPP